MTEPVPSAESADAEAGAAGTNRRRKLGGLWQWWLIGAAAATVFLSLNQLLNLGLFVGHTLLSNQYLYLVVALLLPLVFLYWPLTARSPRDRVPWYDLALALAALGGERPMVRALLDAGASVNARAKRGETSLMVAAIAGHEEVAEMLLQAGAEPRLETRDGVTARLAAILAGHWGVADLIGEYVEDDAPQAGRSPE